MGAPTNPPCAAGPNVGQGVLKKRDTIDRLIGIAAANGLEFAHGEDRVGAIIAKAFANSDFSSWRIEKIA